MLLSITNLLTGDFIIQDPSGLSNFEMKVGPSATKSNVAITPQAFAAIEPLLNAAKTASKITFSVVDDPTSLADDVIAGVRTALVTPVTVDIHDETVVTNLTSAGAVAVSLPNALPIGKIVDIVDGKGDAGTNNITVTPQSGSINGSGTAVIASNYGALRLQKVTASLWVKLA